MAKQFYIWQIEKDKFGCFGLFKSPNGKPINNHTHTHPFTTANLYPLTSSISKAVMIYKMCTLRGINLLTRLQKKFKIKKFNSCIAT